VSAPPRGGGWSGQETLTAVSSMTKDVCRELFSVPLNLIVTVFPAKPVKLKDFWLYPVAWLRLE